MASDPPRASPGAFDHTSDPDFVAYYEQASLSDATRARFEAVREKVLALVAGNGRRNPAQSRRHRLRRGQSGCAVGGARPRSVRPGRERGAGRDRRARRAAAARLPIRFDVGTATALPYDDASMDVCLLPELLEHVDDWESCVREAARVLKPGGVLYLSTTNVLCPVQEEFELPLYSWYPRALKRRYERLAVTTRPELVNHARYPAVHWFSYYGLRDHLARLGFDCLDRFDMIDASGHGVLAGLVLSAVKRVNVLRWVGHVLTPYTVVFAVKNP